MARAKKCDRCGRFYEHYDGYKKFKDTGKANAILLIDRDFDDRHSRRKSYDLCPDCVESLEKWLNAERKQEE